MASGIGGCVSWWHRPRDQGPLRRCLPFGFGWNDRFFSTLRDGESMAALFGPSEQDLERLRSTVQSLRTTSVPGLAAALSWRERKAEKVLARELARPGTPVVYDPGRRVVRWGVIPPSEVKPVAVPEVPPPMPYTGVVPRAPAPVLNGSRLKTLCPTCHAPLLATGSGNLAVCPECGRLASSRTGAPPPEAPATASPSAPTPPGAARGETLTLTDRRSQELFAAWVASKPIPCPKCRTPLRHRALGEYACPSCGQFVRFPKTTEVPAAPAAPGGPA